MPQQIKLSNMQIKILKHLWDWYQVDRGLTEFKIRKNLNLKFKQYPKIANDLKRLFDLKLITTITQVYKYQNELIITDPFYIMTEKGELWLLANNKIKTRKLTQQSKIKDIEAPKGWKFQEINQNDFYLLRTGRKGDWSIKNYPENKKYKDDWILLIFDKSRDKWISKMYHGEYNKYTTRLTENLLEFRVKEKGLRFMTLWAKVMEKMDNMKVQDINDFMLRLFTGEEEVYKFTENLKIQVDDVSVYLGKGNRVKRYKEWGRYSVRASSLQDAKSKIRKGFIPDSDFPQDQDLISSLLNRYIMRYRTKGVI